METIKSELQKLINTCSIELRPFLMGAFKAIEEAEAKAEEARLCHNLRDTWNKHIAPLVGHEAVNGTYEEGGHYWGVIIGGNDHNDSRPKLADNYEDAIKLMIDQPESITYWKLWERLQN